MTSTALAVEPGSWLAQHTNGTWHPADGLSGHLEMDDVFIYLGMGDEESGGQWLQVAYINARDDATSTVAQDSACGTGAGTHVISALAAYADATGVPVRIISIENCAFFRRFDFWDDARLTDADEGDGECWYYPR